MVWAVEPWPPAIGAEGGLDRRDWHFFERAAGVRFSVRDAGAGREGDPSVALHHYVPRVLTASRQLLPPGAAQANRRGPLASPAVGCSGRHHKWEAQMREPEIVCSGTSAVPPSGGPRCWRRYQWRLPWARLGRTPPLRCP
jgi:hypothetical protein